MPACPGMTMINALGTLRAGFIGARKSLYIQSKTCWAMFEMLD